MYSFKVLQVGGVGGFLNPRLCHPNHPVLALVLVLILARNLPLEAPGPEIATLNKEVNRKIVGFHRGHRIEKSSPPSPSKSATKKLKQSP